MQCLFISEKFAPHTAASVALSPSLARWEGEGGAQSEPWAPNALGDVDHRVLLRLGAAVVSGWNELPRDVQRALFRLAVVELTYDPAQLAAQIARFLHDHKDDTGVV